jgi:hypothetical protein
MVVSDALSMLMWMLEHFRVVFGAIFRVPPDLPVPHHSFRSLAAMRESAEAQPASNGQPGPSMSMTSGA